MGGRVGENGLNGPNSSRCEALGPRGGVDSGSCGGRWGEGRWLSWRSFRANASSASIRRASWASARSMRCVAAWRSCRANASSALIRCSSRASARSVCLIAASSSSAGKGDNGGVAMASSSSSSAHNESGCAHSALVAAAADCSACLRSRWSLTRSA